MMLGPLCLILVSQIPTRLSGVLIFLLPVLIKALRLAGLCFTTFLMAMIMVNLFRLLFVVKVLILPKLNRLKNVSLKLLKTRKLMISLILKVQKKKSSFWIIFKNWLILLLSLSLTLFLSLQANKLLYFVPFVCAIRARAKAVQFFFLFSRPKAFGTVARANTALPCLSEYQ